MYMQPALYNDADINENLERLYRDHQSFIFHMIRSIFPIEKVHRVKSFWEINNKLRRCCFSNQKLVDIQFISKSIAATDRVDENVLIDTFLNKSTPIQLIEKHISDKHIALIGENSDKMFSLQGYNAFCMFIKNKVNSGDKKIARVLVNSFISYYSSDIKKKFDLSVSYNLISVETRSEFIQYISKRNVPGIELSYKFIWECSSGRRH